jgi:glycosyltransferase involved in cell wall biosynthesis
VSAIGSPPALLRVSVCICTRNRPGDLVRALESIAASSLPAHQIVVSDDSDGAETEQAVAALDQIAVTYVRGPRTGIGANRNSAIAAADGDFLLFLDDDAILGESFLMAMRSHLEAVPEERRERTILAGTEINHGRTVVPNEQDLLGFQSRPYRPGEPLRTVVINAALFPRELFESVHFDPRLKYGFDEVDFTTQAVARGFSILPCFDASNSHFPSPVGREEYAEAAIAARLYVTLKRRRWTEGSRLRAWLGFVAAGAHVYLASVRRLGPREGVTVASRTIATAWQSYSDHARRRSRAGKA